MSSPESKPVPPITHEPHTVAVTFRHDCLNMVVAVAMCPEGRCVPAHWPDNPPWNGMSITERYRAAGLECNDYTPHPSLNFWDDHTSEVLRTMCSLKLAQHEGRQKTIQWAQAKLVELAKLRPGW